jgi:two-component system, chemotaxis family, chemotaxis protein CheY
VVISWKYSNFGYRYFQPFYTVGIGFVWNQGLWRNMSIYLEDVKILIADDQQFIRSIVRQMLRVLGARDIYDAADGEDAWDSVILNRPDLIIADWQMDPLNGLELTHRIRHAANSPNPYVPIIMMTGHADLDRVTQARDHGVTEFVTKPVAAKSLFNRITTVIENPRTFIRIGGYLGPDRRRRDMVVLEDRRGGG